MKIVEEMDKKAAIDKAKADKEKREKDAADKEAAADAAKECEDKKARKAREQETAAEAKSVKDAVAAKHAAGNKKGDDPEFEKTLNKAAR